MWQTADGSEQVSADGGLSGTGKLVGVLFNDYQLGTPFELGTDGEVTAPDDGQLLLRCRDEWNQLSDNNGTISVELMSGKKG